MVDKSSSRETGRATRRGAAVPFLAGGIAAALTVGVVVASGGGAAGAADTVDAQSVGRFLDGAVGGNPIQSIVDLKDARAKAPGTQSQQNPLDATLLGQAEIPIGNALKQPGGGVFTLGAANQVAVAKTSGYSYGASGAVSNSGGVSLGGNDNSYPADASVTLSDASLGSITIPSIPGAPTLPTGSGVALGGASADIGAVSALAKTATGGGFEKPTYKIASVDLSLSSPALGSLFQQLAAGGTQLSTLLTAVSSNLPTPSAFPADCALTNGTLPTTSLTLDGGAVTVNPSTGAITVSVSKLLDQLGVDINSLPPNTDLLDYVLNNLSTILSTGLENVVNGLVNPIQDIGSKCLTPLETLIDTLGPLSTVLGDAYTALTSDSGESAIESAVNTIAGQLGSGASSSLPELTDQLANVADIGVNVQQGAYPLSSESKPKYKFTSGLEETPDQATPIVSGQAVVRAIEIDLLNTSALSTDSLQAKPLTKGARAAAPLAAAAAKTPAISLALGNAAVGPTSLTSAAASPSNTAAAAPASAVPTGVPAGQAQHASASTPSAVLSLLALLALMVVGSGAFVYRRRRGGFLH